MNQFELLLNSGFCAQFEAKSWLRHRFTFRRLYDPGQKIRECFSGLGLTKILPVRHRIRGIENRRRRPDVGAILGNVGYVFIAHADYITWFVTLMPFFAGAPQTKQFW